MLWGPSIPQISNPPEIVILSPSELFAAKLQALLEPLAQLNRVDHPIPGAMTRSILPREAAASGSKSGVIISRFLGSPAAVAYLEPYLASGAKQVFLYGPAGALAGLSLGDLVFATTALSFEGTSRFYLDSSRIGSTCDHLVFSLAHAKASIVSAASGLCEEQAITLQPSATVATTDAPFRETAEWCRAAISAGASCVDMECSAVAALCAHYNTPLTACFVVSDLVGPQPISGFGSTPLKRGLNVLLQTMVELIYS